MAPQIVSRVKSWISNASIGKLVFFGLVVRLVMLIYSAFHDATFRVKYTDIDYSVITDGAKEMVEGKSPFARATFRYTPILSALMVPNVLVWHHLGKFLFIGADLLAGYLAHAILSKSLASSHPQSQSVAKLNVAVWILFNPIVINVSTRGNADMLLTVMTLLVLHFFYKGQLVSASLVLGFATHFKVYPIIYAAPLVFGLLASLQNKRPKRSTWLSEVGLPWVYKSSLCGVVTVIAFTVPTLICGHFYGEEYYFESLIYHFGRVDHRHNLSPYFYPAYLNMVPSPKKEEEYGGGYSPCSSSSDMVECYRPIIGGGGAGNVDLELQSGIVAAREGNNKDEKTVDFIPMLKNKEWTPDQQDYGLLVALAFLPQFAALVFSSFKLRHNVAHAFCIETLLFVAYNKVCTVQYFVWFIPFIPFILSEVMLLSSSSSSSGRVSGKRGESRQRQSSEVPSLSSDEETTSVALQNLACGKMSLLVVVFWFGSLITWMLIAKGIEFDGVGTNFYPLWVASCLFYIAQMVIILWLGAIAVKVQRLGTAAESRKDL